MINPLNHLNPWFPDVCNHVAIISYFSVEKCVSIWLFSVYLHILFTYVNVKIPPMAFLWWLVNDSTTTETVQARCVAASYRAYRAESLGGHDRKIMERGFTWVHQYFSSLHLFFTLLLGKRPYKFTSSRQRQAQTKWSKKIQKAEFFGIVIAATASWIGICFIEDMD